MLKPSSRFVRLLYCLCLGATVLSLWHGMHNLALLVGTPRSLGIMNILVAVIPNAAVAVAFLLLATRLIGVLTGKFKLNIVAKSGPIRAMRVAAIFIMILNVVPWLISLIGALSYRGAGGVGFAFMALSLGGGTPYGLMIFEASRLLEREVLLEPRNGTSRSRLAR